MNDHIYTPDDGRGMRRVYLNGREIDRVVYANTKKGVLRFIPDPMKMDKYRKRVILKTLHGNVEVKPWTSK